ncbi:MAG: glucose-6-phosphate isomerase [Clostridia bacterium]|nr:glucose-6-phosphate isomerase [Clostridia bacterium]
MISFDFKGAGNFITPEEIADIEKEVLAAHDMLHNGTGAGSDMTGWLDLPEKNDKSELKKIKAAATKIRKTAKVLIVIGVGGSYLGARAAIDFLNDTFYNLQPDERRRGPQIFFAGISMSATYMAELINITKDRDFCINVISKSGTTTEPAIAFRIFKELAEKKYGKEGAKERIFVTTDKEKGALYTMAVTEGYERFVIPDNVGGRYSVLTAVGLLPIAVCGADINAIMLGAYDAMKLYSNKSVWENDCYMYAAVRNLLYRKGKTIEIMANCEDTHHFIGEWWKQLFGESEGKDGKGIFPATANYTTELHSIGQYIQDGLRNLFETVIRVHAQRQDIEIKANADNLDELNYLAGMSLNHINMQAFLGAALAHTDGNVPVLEVAVDRQDEYSFGCLVYFFEKACAISGYLLGVNPFDQPGVEAYKRNMFALLGKPSYESLREELVKRL